jgi:hypothetical protein
MAYGLWLMAYGLWRAGGFEKTANSCFLHWITLYPSTAHTAVTDAIAIVCRYPNALESCRIA